MILTKLSIIKVISYQNINQHLNDNEMFYNNKFN